MHNVIDNLHFGEYLELIFLFVLICACASRGWYLEWKLEFQEKTLKESISHGLRTGRFPSWFGSKLHCELNLPREDNDNFGTFLHGLQKETTSAFGNSILSYLEHLVSEKESGSNKGRTFKKSASWNRRLYLCHWKKERLSKP